MRTGQTDRQTDRCFRVRPWRFAKHASRGIRWLIVIIVYRITNYRADGDEQSLVGTGLERDVQPLRVV